MRKLLISFANCGVNTMKKNKCNVTTCRYNQDGQCINEDKREECVEVSRKVLCLEDRENESENQRS